MTTPFGATVASFPAEPNTLERSEGEARTDTSTISPAVFAGFPRERSSLSSTRARGEAHVDRWPAAVRADRARRPRASGRSDSRAAPPSCWSGSSSARWSSRRSARRSRSSPASAGLAADARPQAPRPEAEPEPERRRPLPEEPLPGAATLGLGGLVAAGVALPAAGFAVLPSLTGQRRRPVDLGPLDAFPEGRFVIATFLSDPEAGEVSRRAAYIRNNGLVDGVPSFTAMSSRCTHVGCPTQPNGPVFNRQHRTERTPSGDVGLVPTLPAGGFGCPCHGSQFDDRRQPHRRPRRESSRPVRVLDSPRPPVARPPLQRQPRRRDPARPRASTASRSAEQASPPQAPSHGSTPSTQATDRDAPTHKEH